jgi:hypothetical protein
MRTCLFIAALLFCGCVHTNGPFVQDGIRIVPPVSEEGSDPVSHTLTFSLFNDGGTRWVKITDAEGKKFDVYIDHRINSPTPAAIYLNAYPGKPDSVLVVDQKDFRKKIGVFE